MTDPFDYDGLTAHIRAIRTHDDAYNALRERIEAAFVPIEHHTAVITDHDELLQREIARAEAAEAENAKLREALRECRDQLWHLAKDPASNPWIKQADDALGGEHAG